MARHHGNIMAILALALFSTPMLLAERPVTRRVAPPRPIERFTSLTHNRVATERMIQEYKAKIDELAKKPAAERSTIEKDRLAAFTDFHATLVDIRTAEADRLSGGVEEMRASLSSGLDLKNGGRELTPERRRELEDALGRSEKRLKDLRESLAERAVQATNNGALPEGHFTTTFNLVNRAVLEASNSSGGASTFPPALEGILKPIRDVSEHLKESNCPQCVTELSNFERALTANFRRHLNNRNGGSEIDLAELSQLQRAATDMVNHYLGLVAGLTAHNAEVAVAAATAAGLPAPERPAHLSEAKLAEARTNVQTVLNTATMEASGRPTETTGGTLAQAVREATTGQRAAGLAHVAEAPGARREGQTDVAGGNARAEGEISSDVILKAGKTLSDWTKERLAELQTKNSGRDLQKEYLENNEDLQDLVARGNQERAIRERRMTEDQIKAACLVAPSSVGSNTQRTQLREPPCPLLGTALCGRGRMARAAATAGKILMQEVAVTGGGIVGASALVNPGSNQTPTTHR